MRLLLLLFPLLAGAWTTSTLSAARRSSRAASRHARSGDSDEVDPARQAQLDRLMLKAREDAQRVQSLSVACLSAASACKEAATKTNWYRDRNLAVPRSFQQAERECAAARATARAVYDDAVQAEEGSKDAYEEAAYGVQRRAYEQEQERAAEAGRELRAELDEVRRERMGERKETDTAARQRDRETEPRQEGRELE